jgi:hypothetical protein
MIARLAASFDELRSMVGNARPSKFQRAFFSLRKDQSFDVQNQQLKDVLKKLFDQAL